MLKVSDRVVSKLAFTFSLSQSQSLNHATQVHDWQLDCILGAWLLGRIDFVEVGFVLPVNLLQLHLHLTVGDLIIGLEEAELRFIEVFRLSTRLQHVCALRFWRAVGSIAQFLRLKLFLWLRNEGRLDWHCQHLQLVKGPLEPCIVQSRRIVVLRSVNVV